MEIHLRKIRQRRTVHNSVETEEQRQRANVYVSDKTEEERSSYFITCSIALSHPCIWSPAATICLHVLKCRIFLLTLKT